MSSRKSHHYIPQFYLRNFSSTENKKEIGLYNHIGDIYVEAASIKHQACKNFLYGDNDEIEIELSKLEYYTSLTIQKLFEIQLPPPEDTIYFKILKKFILCQLSRTVKAGKDINEAVSIAVKEVFKNSNIYKEEYKNIVFRHEKPELLSLLYSSQYLPLLDYLSCKLIINISQLPFITSDNPTIKYNQFLESKKLRYGTNGLASKGLQIFLPIHPLMLLIFYDPLVYKLGDRQQKTLFTSDINDIRQLNALQYINSNFQLFFGDRIYKRYLEQLVEKYKSVRKLAGPISKTFENGKTYAGKSSYHLMNTYYEPQINLGLSFIKLTKSAKEFELDNRLIYFRHPSFEKLREENMNQIVDDLPDDIGI